MDSLLFALLSYQKIKWKSKQILINYKLLQLEDNGVKKDENYFNISRRNIEITVRYTSFSKDFSDISLLLWLMDLQTIKRGNKENKIIDKIHLFLKKEMPSLWETTSTISV